MDEITVLEAAVTGIIEAATITEVVDGSSIGVVILWDVVLMVAAEVKDSFFSETIAAVNKNNDSSFKTSKCYFSSFQPICCNMFKAFVIIRTTWGLFQLPKILKQAEMS